MFQMYDSQKMPSLPNLCVYIEDGHSQFSYFFSMCLRIALCYTKIGHSSFIFPHVSECRFRILSELLLAVTKPLLYWKADLNFSCINPPNQRVAHTRPWLAWRFLLPTVVLFLELASRSVGKIKRESTGNL